MDIQTYFIVSYALSILGMLGIAMFIFARSFILLRFKLWWNRRRGCVIRLVMVNGNEYLEFGKIQENGKVIIEKNTLIVNEKKSTSWFGLNVYTFVSGSATAHNFREALKELVEEQEDNKEVKKLKVYVQEDYFRKMSEIDSMRFTQMLNTAKGTNTSIIEEFLRYKDLFKWVLLAVGGIAAAAIFGFLTWQNSELIIEHLTKAGIITV